MQQQGEPQARRTPFMSIFPTKILLATDGSREAELAATTAADLAEKTNSELHIVTVSEDPYLATDFTLHFPEAAERHRQEVREEVQALLDRQVERFQEAGGKVAQPHLKVGRADDKIVSLAEEVGAGLVVMGSRGQGGIRRALMGSVSSSVVEHAPCPVMVVRPEKEQVA
jgi:nucleotide-binding universal stress UspA family protein